MVLGWKDGRLGLEKHKMPLLAKELEARLAAELDSDV